MAEKSKKNMQKAAYTNRHNASEANLRREIQTQGRPRVHGDSSAYRNPVRGGSSEGVPAGGGGGYVPPEVGPYSQYQFPNSTGATGQYAPPMGVPIRPRNMQYTVGPQTSGQGVPNPNPPQWGADPIPYQFAHPMVQAWAQNPNLAYFGGNGGIGGHVAAAPQPAPDPRMLAYYNSLQPWG